MSNGTLPQQAQQPAQNVYSTTVLNQSLIESMVQDDSPDILWNKFWPFLGVDIPVADIKDFDFKNILDYVELAIYEILEEYPEEEWENVAIVEYEKKVDAETKTVTLEPVKYYKISSLQNLMKAKTYLKMCRARDGFTLKTITESKSVIEEKTNMPLGIPQGMQPKRKKKWGFI